MNLKDFAIGNIEEVLNNHFAEMNLTRKERKQLACDMAVIASNAYRIGYYAGMKTATGLNFTSEAFDETEKGSDTMADMLWRIQEAES
jgi:hypothetical protein